MMYRPMIATAPYKAEGRNAHVDGCILVIIVVLIDGFAGGVTTSTVTFCGISEIMFSHLLLHPPNLDRD